MPCGPHRGYPRDLVSQLLGRPETTPRSLATGLQIPAPEDRIPSNSIEQFGGLTMGNGETIAECTPRPMQFW